MRNRQKEKKAGEKIRTPSMINLFILGTGFVLVMLNMSPLMVRAGNGLVVAGAISVVFTIAYQVMMMARLRRERKNKP